MKTEYARKLQNAMIARQHDAKVTVQRFVRAAILKQLTAAIKPVRMASVRKKHLPKNAMRIHSPHAMRKVKPKHASIISLNTRIAAP